MRKKGNFKLVLFIFAKSYKLNKLYSTVEHTERKWWCGREKKL